MPGEWDDVLDEILRSHPSELCEDWDYYYGWKPSSPDSVEAARRWLRGLPDDLVPREVRAALCHGGVDVWFGDGPGRVSVTFYPENPLRDSRPLAVANFFAKGEKLRFCRADEARSEIAFLRAHLCES